MILLTCGWSDEIHAETRRASANGLVNSSPPYLVNRISSAKSDIHRMFAAMITAQMPSLINRSRIRAFY